MACCAQELTVIFGGFYYDDHNTELSMVEAGVAGARGAQVVAVWKTLLDDEQAMEQRLDDQEMREWEAARAKDPEGYDAANDWSDVG